MFNVSSYNAPTLRFSGYSPTEQARRTENADASKIKAMTPDDIITEFQRLEGEYVTVERRLKYVGTQQEEASLCDQRTGISDAITKLARGILAHGTQAQITALDTSFAVHMPTFPVPDSLAREVAAKLGG